MTRMDEEIPQRPGLKRRSRARRIQDFIPLCFTYSVVIVTWTLFTVCIIINDALVHRHDTIRAGILFSISITLFAFTILSLLTASTRSPGQPDPHLTPEGVREAQERKDLDEDDIPLGRLRKGRPQDLSLAPAQQRATGSSMESAKASSGSSVYSIEVSPFPLTVSPFVPTTTTNAGEEEEDDGDTDTKSNELSKDGQEGDQDHEGTEGDEDRLLPEYKHGPTNPNRKSLFAKNSSGGRRWCSKCDAWKPDRCHHCRYCKRCTLKMDHHCIWIGICVGYHNYKPFLLFVSYGTLLAFTIFVGSVLSMINYLTHPEDYTSSSPSGMDVSELTPVSFMLLTFIGAFFTMTIGGLAGYHWYLVCNNKTTLEDITHSYPSALIEDRRRTTENQSEWRGDHLLTRPERVRLREEASALNVYDLGRRRNVLEVLLGSGRRGFRSYLSSLWPLSVSRDRLERTAGHYFEFDPVKLERLQDLTIELRLGQRPDEDEGEE